MGCWDIFCPLCGNTCHQMLKQNETDSDTEYDDVYKNIIKKTLWLNKCTFLTADNKVIHNTRETACNVEFSHKGKIYINMHKYENTFDSMFVYGVKNYGVFVHDDCWKFVKDHYGIELKLSNLFIDKNNMDANKVLSIKYGKIEDYWAQDFDFVQMYNDGNEYMCESPLKNKKNATRIGKIFTKLKLKPDRKSPSSSATLYKKGTIKIGNDNNFWIQSKGKWVKMKGDINVKQITLSIKDKKHMKLLNTLVQIGESNTKPIFVKSFEIGKKDIKLDLLCLE